MSAAEFLQFDLPAMLVGSLAALVCGLLGNFLVLRRQSLLGDAISHVVLPGIVLGFLVAGKISTWPMLIGAGVAALVAVGLIELIKRLSKLETGAAMGVVFTSMFAGGVVLLEQTGARGVHLDVEHALYGNVEGTTWLVAKGWSSLLDPTALSQLPTSILRLGVVAILAVSFVVLFFKELRLVTFDPAFARNIGFAPRGLGLALIVFVSAAAVAAFDAVGSILVIAMFICPAATARMLTDRLSTQLWASALIAFLSGTLGYVVAALVPLWLGFDTSLKAAGMIALVAGAFQVIAMVFAPQHGVLSKARRQAKMSQKLASDDSDDLVEFPGGKA